MDDMIDTQQAYREKAKARLDQLDSKIDNLKARFSEATADAKIGLDQKLEELQDRMDEGREQMRNMQEDSGDNLEDYKKKISGLLDGIEDKLKSIGSD